MRYLALASDYDGTLACDGAVGDTTLAGLKRFRQSGRKLILVTGRVLEDLESVFPHLDLFDRVVAENGAVLYSPAAHQKRGLAEPPPPVFLESLRRRRIRPLGNGDVIIATSRPNEAEIVTIIGELGLELQVIFNKNSVMILPSGVNKKTGLDAALAELKLSEHNVAAIGDAENDHAFLRFCELSAAVANAIPALKETADLVTRSPRGGGVVELIDRILAGDLGRPANRRIVIAHQQEKEISIPAWDASLLVAGASGSGKSTFVSGFLETLIHSKYQTCLIDPEGDYGAFPGTIAVGGPKTPPSIDLVLQAMEKPDSQTIVNMLGVPLEDRPVFFSALLPRLEEMRLRTGRPHWIVIDEAHHMLPRTWTPARAGGASELKNLVLITVHPDHVAAPVLQSVDAVIAVGRDPGSALREFGASAAVPVPRTPAMELPQQEALLWMRGDGEPRRVRLIESEMSRQRHKRKYAHGELGETDSFYFEGPERKLHLRAQNLMTFLQISDGIDDDTWQYHLKNGDYSRWFREKIKDEDLTGEAEQIERDAPPPDEARRRMRKAVERRYTAPE